MEPDNVAEETAHSQFILKPDQNANDYISPVFLKFYGVYKVIKKSGEKALLLSKDGKEKPKLITLAKYSSKLIRGCNFLLIGLF